jgi:CheY-like chemotaxis protein
MSFAPEELLAVLPHARRYARALTGSQQAGDALVGRAIPVLDPAYPPRLALYAGISRLAATASVAEGGLTLRQRQVLLLTTLEELTEADVARVLRLDAATVAAEAEDARDRLRAAAATRVLIIEDEPVIALDLQLLTESCGHHVVGIASTEAEAIAIAADGDVGLILADVNLGRGGNGISAVRTILESTTVPVIFVTAYPELLLTASGMEPAFIMSKPFDPMTLAVATYQAVHGGKLLLTPA